MTVLPPLRAPAADGALLAVPPLGEAGRLLAQNQERLDRLPRSLLCRSWQDLRALARRELLALAGRYTGLAFPDDAVSSPLILAGHQPELFHPGVWIKNFALAGLARRHGGTAVNLLVDNDTVKSTGVVVPVPGDPWPEARTLLFDAGKGETPWEERRIEDPELFARFGEEASALLRRWGYEPLLTEFWPEVRRYAKHNGGRLGESFAAARRTLEQSWGCRNLEVPLSHLCRGEAFAWLAAALVAELPRFVEVHNATVHEHRARHGIRSRHHPVPDLARDGDWLELPLWGWRPDRPRRGRLFARLLSDRVELRAGNESWPVLPPAGTVRFVEAWRGLEEEGYRVRSRALVTTLFARLFLGDLFLHGIGGGKYDEMNDTILRRFWGVEPPAFLVVSATRWLPLPAVAVSEADRRRQAGKVRDLYFNPQRHLSGKVDGHQQELARTRAEWVARQPPTRAGRRERYRRLRQLTEALRGGVAVELEQAREDLRRLEEQLAASALLRRRDFAFCLYPEAALRAFCTRLL